MIQFSHVHFGYRKQPLYRDLQMKVLPGHIYGLLGKNGAGKSTFLKLITGLVFATSGKVQVLGHDPSKRQPSFLQDIFLIPEEIDTPDLDVLLFADDHLPFYPHFNKEQFIHLLKEFEVPLVNLKEMSYGQKKKTWIALGIAANTSLLLLDEPTNGLDIPSKKQFRKMMAAAVNEERCVIISTHQIRDLDSLIDSIVIVDEGELVVNTAVDHITEKLAFKQFPDEGSAANSIYSENTLMGTHAVIPNEQQEESRMDIELFFNAAIGNKKRMQQLFNA
jgi:ABC-2 type transport system ATP-binding protein